VGNNRANTPAIAKVKRVSKRVENTFYENCSIAIKEEIVILEEVFWKKKNMAVNEHIGKEFEGWFLSPISLGA
jgi:hypothetical protein